jgi:curli biogenesis system outer membrane secretion channel CsgG
MLLLSRAGEGRPLSPERTNTAELNVKISYSCSFVLVLALSAPASGQGLVAQTGSDSTVAPQTGLTVVDPAKPMVAIQPPIPAPPIHADKPALMVMGFESGTVSAQVKDKRGFMAMLTGRRGENEKYDPSQLGVGIADMLIEKLLATGQFRLLERKPQESTTGRHFIVTGSVTRFGFEERNVGGFAANVATMGLLSVKRHKTDVVLTARVINAATGEIVASMTSEGISGKGGGLRVFGMGSNGAGGGDLSTSNFRSTAIGQATERAVAHLAEKIAEKKASF